MSALTSLLVRDEVVSVRQIEDALARQVLEGGELDTALLELDAAAENVLNAYCAASLRLPAAAREDVMSSGSSVLALLSHEQAEKFYAIPITHDSTTLVVATSRPLTEESRRELGRAIGMQVECCVACEVRIAAALARFYRRPMSARMERLAERIEQRDPGTLPPVEPMLETPLSGLAAELFDDADDFDEPAGAAPIPYQLLKPAEPAQVRMGHVVEVPPSPLLQAASDPSLRPQSDEAPRRPSGASRPDTQRGVGTSSYPAPDATQQALPAVSVGLATASELQAAPAAVRALPTTTGPLDVVRTAVAASKSTVSFGAKRTAVPQGPLSRELAGQLLDRADDRDAVVDVFFRYARQYFDATALCAIREDRVLGREVHNVPNLSDIRGLSLSVVRGSALDELVRTLQPRVEDLARRVEDLPLAEALRRTLCQPSALLPICIQRRVVAIVYGDRGGEYFRQQDLGPLIELLPEVSRAFERIIRTRKVLGLSSRARSLAHAKAELGHAATQLDVLAASAARLDLHDHEKTEALLRNARRALSALGVPRTAPPPPAAARVSAALQPRPSAAALEGQLHDAWAASVARGAAARMPGSLDPVAALDRVELRPALRGRSELEELERIPTARLPAVTEPDAPSDAELDDGREPAPPQPAYLSKPPPGAGRYSSVRVGARDEPELDFESDTKRLRTRGLRDPVGPRRSAPPNASATLDTSDSLETPRFESPLPDPRVAFPRPSKPPPGTGMYHQQDVMSEVISLAPPPAKRRSSQPAPANPRRSPQPAPAARSASSHSTPGETSNKRSSKRPPPAPDVRRQDPDETPLIGFGAQTQTASSLESREATVIVDTQGQTLGLVDDLCGCGPDDEGPIVQSLLRVGGTALDLLIERFPGPLWFDRRKPYARLPFGRDTGPVTRALAAFGEAAVPRLVPLLRSPKPDVRYYATLFVSDRVHPELLAPIAERLFDDDPQIRLMVRDALPAYKQQPGFAQVLGSLRTRMLEARAPLPARLAAIDAAAHLRDGASVPALVELLAHADRQLSVPAHRALVAITCQDFGSSTKKWRLWFEDNQHRHRVQWLIDSLMNGEQNLRSAAGIELQKVTQVYYGYVASAPKRERERAQKRYQDWWDGDGRKKL